jgi:hypothetical protein
MPDPTQFDPYRVRVVLDHGEVVELDGGTLVLDGEESPSVVLRLAPWRARSVARVLQEWTSHPSPRSRDTPLGDPPEHIALGSELFRHTSGMQTQLSNKMVRNAIKVAAVHVGLAANSKAKNERLMAVWVGLRLTSVVSDLLYHFSYASRDQAAGFQRSAQLADIACSLLYETIDHGELSQYCQMDPVVEYDRVGQDGKGEIAASTERERRSLIRMISRVMKRCQDLTVAVSRDPGITNIERDAVRAASEAAELIGEQYDETGNRIRKLARGGRKILSKGVATLLVISGVITAAVVVISNTPQAYNSTIGHTDYLYKRLYKLSVQSPISYFENLLGPHRFELTDGVYRQYIYTDPSYFVLAKTDTIGRVVYYSITTRNAAFNPTFHFEEMGFPGGQLVLGKTKMAEFGTPNGIAAHTYVDRGSKYGEIYWGANPGNFQNIVVSVGLFQAGLNLEASDKYSNTSGDILLGNAFLLQDQPIDDDPRLGAYLSDPVAAEFRKNAVIHTLTVTEPWIGQTDPHAVKNTIEFGIDQDQARLSPEEDNVHK